MDNRIRSIYPCVLKKEFSPKFCVYIRVRQEKPEEGRRTHQPKRRKSKNKDEDNSPNTLNSKSFPSVTSNSGRRFGKYL